MVIWLVNGLGGTVSRISTGKFGRAALVIRALLNPKSRASQSDADARTASAGLEKLVFATRPRSALESPIGSQGRPALSSL